MRPVWQPLVTAIRSEHPDVEVAAADPRTGWYSSFPREEADVVQAVTSRRYEYFCGRALARRLLTHLGRSPQAIPRQPDRRPQWPDGIVGSIAHCEDVCIVALTASAEVRAVGLDVEPAAAMEPAMMDVIAVEAEKAELDPDGHGAKALFVAKEAFYKAQYTLTRTFLDFHEARVRFEHTWPFEQTSFAASAPKVLARPLSGSIARIGHHWLAWVVVRASG